MPLPRNYADKQLKPTKEIAQEAQFAPVHEPRSATAEGTQSFSPPPLQLQASGAAPARDHHPDTASPAAPDTASPAAPVAAAPATASPELSGPPSTAPATTTAPTQGPDDGLRGSSEPVTEGPENTTVNGPADGLPPIGDPDGGTGDVNPADGLAEIGGDSELGGAEGADRYDEDRTGSGVSLPACEADGAVNDWTAEERAELDMGTDIRADLSERISPECEAEVEEYAREIFNEEASCSVRPQHGRNPEVELCTGDIDYTDVHGMMEQFGEDLPTDVQRVVAYNEMFEGVERHSGGFSSIVDHRDLNPDMHDPVAAGSSWKHTIVPFDDNYHGRIGGVDGDAMEPWSEQPTPTFLDQGSEADMDWLNGLPMADSMATGEDQISTAYAEILRRESIPPGVTLWNNPDLFLRRSIAGTFPDAQASLGTIENFRDFRSDGWGAFTDGFRDRMLVPPGGE